MTVPSELWNCSCGGTATEHRPWCWMLLPDGDEGTAVSRAIHRITEREWATLRQELAYGDVPRARAALTKLFDQVMRKRRNPSR